MHMAMVLASRDPGEVAGWGMCTGARRIACPCFGLGAGIRTLYCKIALTVCM